MHACIVKAMQWSLPYLDFNYWDTSIIQDMAQLNQ